MKQKFMGVMPRTSLGKISVALIMAMPAFFVLGSSFADSLYRSVSSGDTILADIVTRPFLALTMLAGMISGSSAFFAGAIAIVKNKDYTFLAYLATVLGGLLITFLIGEIVFPH